MISKEEYDLLIKQHDEGCKTYDFSKIISAGDDNYKKIKLYESQFCKHSRVKSHQGGQIEECLDCGKIFE